MVILQGEGGALMDDKLRKGTSVKIVKDVREGEPAKGKNGKVVGYEDGDAWLLCTADGKLERESYELPDGYVEWDSENEPFPKVNCGILSRNPRFLLDDGTYIHGGQCYWEPTNPLVKVRVYMAMRKLMQKMGISDKEIRDIEEQAFKQL